MLPFYNLQIMDLLINLKIVKNFIFQYVLIKFYVYNQHLIYFSILLIKEIIILVCRSSNDNLFGGIFNFIGSFYIHLSLIFSYINYTLYFLGVKFFSPVTNLFILSLSLMNGINADSILFGSF